jgi:diketogulonate reductase-like aldo/keto reductase
VTGRPPIAEERVELASGTTMPLLGLGTWQIRGRSAVDAVRRALEVGYRHLDTATMYANEAQVGQALAASGVPRDEVFVTTKLPPSRAGHEQETLAESLDALGLAYVDLWLVHWPPAGGARPDVWERLLELQAEGLAREVGVSNYSVRQLDELERATGRLPAVNQIEWSPALFDGDVLDAHRSRGVQLEQPLPDVRTRASARRPVDEPEVDVGEGERVEALGECLPFVPRAARRQLRRDEDLVARDAARGECLSDLRLVGVHRRGVEVPVANLQRPADRVDRGAAADLPRAEPEQRHRRARGELDTLLRDRQPPVHDGILAAPPPVPSPRADCGTLHFYA